MALCCQRTKKCAKHLCKETAECSSMASQIKLLHNCAIWAIYLIFIVAPPVHSEEKPILYSITPPPSCVNNKGERVAFENVENNQSDSAAGMAKRDENGDPVVYRFNYKNSPEHLQKFIDFHECAHHQTGDVDLPHPPRNSPDHMMNESIADCIATLRIRDEIKNGADVILQAVEELMKAMTKIGFHEATMDTRKLNILNCLNKDNSVESFTDDILRHRELK